MRKGLSAWLFSKMVMLAFLLIVFSIMGGFLTILNERAFNDSASIFCLQAREFVSGVVNSNVIGMQKVLPIPKVLPYSESPNKRMYYLVISYNSSNPPFISFAVTHDLLHKNVFVSSALLYLPSVVSLSTTDFYIDSGVYRYLIIQKEGGDLSLFACRGMTSMRFINCLSGRNPTGAEVNVTRI